MPVHIAASYAFFPLSEEETVALQQELSAFGEERKMKGLVLIAEEGINSTVCGSQQAIAQWKARIRQLHPEMVFKDSTAEGEVFRRWSVKVKKEIVTLRKPGIRPQGTHKHLSPAAWNEMLQDKDAVVIDARNTFEVAIGKFRGAVDPGIRYFHQFPDFVRASNLPKDQKVLLYCTGGIRCEKAVLAMEAEGYENVYQLDGGILKYLEQFPEREFEGECFVFDHRVAVDQQLQPSKTFILDPVTGDPCRVGR